MATADSTKGWKQLAFSRGKSNIVEKRSSGLSIAVDQSAGPLVYGFAKTQRIIGLRVRGSTDGMIALPINTKQGAAGSDDFVFRIGVIVEGKKKLNAFKLGFAPSWVKEISKLSPNRKTLEKVIFFNVNNSSTGWEKRLHPQAHNLIEERIALTLTTPGAIDFTAKFESPVKVMGLWISCDGDDTRSKFNVLLNQVELITE